LAQDKIEFIESNFYLIDKNERLVGMKLKPAQRHYIENHGKRNVCLKGRQMGFSTGVLADNSADLFRLPYQRQTIITHDTEVSEFLFQNVQRFYRNLPWNQGITDERKLQPIHDWKSGTRMRFPIIDSYIYIDSAKSDSIGAGHTLTKVHASELAKWKPENKARQLWADITQTVPLGGCITAESTPQGKAGLFYELYHDAKSGQNGFQNFFYPWWWEPDYVENPDIYMTDEKAEIIAAILGQSFKNYVKDEKALAGVNNLSPQQIAFRRAKLMEIKLLFFQEYPENDIDCWISSEQSVIDGASLRPYYQDIRNGMINGDLTIWKDAVGGRNYVIGADVASGQARDYSVAAVLDTKSLEYVARLRGKIRTDMFAEQLYALGMRYNQALIGVERIGHGQGVLKILLEKEYPNLYYHTDYDQMKAANITDVGWKTSMRTKPLMVNGMIQVFQSRDLISWSENLLAEASGLTWEGGTDSRIKTSAGGNDDEWDAVSIALQIREGLPVYENTGGGPVVSSYVR